MTRIEYELLREDRPELQLVNWYAMPSYWQDYVRTLDREQLIARRTGVLLGREYGYYRDSFDLHPAP